MVGVLDVGKEVTRAALTALACAVTVAAAAATAPAPLAVLVEKETLAHAPDGSRILLPAGTRIDACGPGDPVVYALESKLFRLPEPCDQPFANGFEEP
jgi:hypothetical protein